MRIAYFTDTFLPQINGIATALANQARELGARGHKVLIFTPKLDDIPRQKFQAKNIQIVHLPTVPALLYPEFKLGIFGFPKVVQTLIKFKPDIIHLHTPLTVGLDAILAAKTFNKPLVGTIHIYFADSNYIGWIKDRIKNKLAVKLMNKAAQGFPTFMFNQCSLLLAPSKMLIRELTGVGFKKNISYLPNGIILGQTKIFSKKAKDNIKKKYGLREKVILHFGRLSHEKNIDVLIKSFQALAKKHENISLLIIGDGPDRKKLVKLVQKLDLTKEVIFTGFIEHQQLLSSGFLNVADVFATASTMENNPMVVLEAMASRLPVVGVRQAGLIELIRTNGYLVEPGNIKMMAQKMEQIIFEDDLAKKMGEKSLEAVKPYDIKAVVDQLLAYYKDLNP